MSDNFKSFLEITFKKKFEVITKEELTLVENILIKDIQDLEFIKNFPNLKTINFEKCKINLEIICKLPMLIKMEFYKCYIDIRENENTYERLNTIIFNNCFLKDINFLKNTKNIVDFELINPYNDFELDLSLVSKNINLGILCIEGVIIDEENMISQFSNLQILSLLNSSISSIKFLDSLINLKELYIEKKWMDSNYAEEHQKKLVIMNSINNLLYDSEL